MYHGFVVFRRCYLLLFVSAIVLLFIETLKLPPDNSFYGQQHELHLLQRRENAQVFASKNTDIENNRIQENIFVEENCACVDNATKRVYDFCYRFPENRSIHGTKFSCEFLPILQRLGLLDNDNAIETIDLRKDAFPTPVFITSVSESHSSGALKVIGRVQRFLPEAHIIVYDLGLKNETVSRIADLCNVEIRQFVFDALPEHVKDLRTYRWKPLVIADALRTNGAVWYMDASVVLLKGQLDHVYELLKCKAHSFRPITSLRRNFTRIATDQQLFDPVFIESDVHLDRLFAALKRCDKSPYMLQGYTGHGIFSVTHPGVYKYFPTSLERLKQRSAKMYEAGFILAVKTSEMLQHILKWYVLCALEESCMAPDGAQAFGCMFDGPDRFSTYAGCHRFDQSIINLILANRNRFHSYYWSSGIVDFFKIERGGREERGGYPKTC